MRRSVSVVIGGLLGFWVLRSRSTKQVITLKKIVKSGKEEDAYGSSSLSRLPDDIILQILNRLIDMKSLCFCYLVSKRFSKIVVRVDTITFTVPLLNPPVGYEDNQGGILRNLFSILISDPIVLRVFASKRDERELFPFVSAITFLRKFKGVKSLSIELPSSSKIATDNRCVFKWKVKFGSRIESFSFLLETDEQEEVTDMGFGNKFYKQYHGISLRCLKDVNQWHMMLLYFVKNLSMLEKISVTDSVRNGRLSLSGEKLREVKAWVHSVSKSVMNRFAFPHIVSNCYIPALNLPVSGKVMKGVYLLHMEMNGNQGEYDNSNEGFEGKEEAAFTEALMEILKKHQSRMVRLLNGELVIEYPDSGSE